MFLAFYCGVSHDHFPSSVQVQCCPAMIKATEVLGSVISQKNLMKRVVDWNVQLSVIEVSSRGIEWTSFWAIIGLRALFFTSKVKPLKKDILCYLWSILNVHLWFCLLKMKCFVSWVLSWAVKMLCHLKHVAWSVIVIQVPESYKSFWCLECFSTAHQKRKIL